MNLSDKATLHSPVSVEFTAPTAVTLSGVAASAGLDTLRYSTAGTAALPAVSWLWVVAGAGAALSASRLRRRK